MRTPVELYTVIERPAMLIRDALFSVMPTIQAGKPPYDSLGLAVSYRDVRIDLEGRLQVPIDVDARPRRLRWECDLTIEAQHGKRLFPRFTGTLSVMPSTNNTSELWLQGYYEVPFGTPGELFDAHVAPGAARQSLQHFVDWLGDELTRAASISA